MKIGILTITPNIGFGGIMQAYALKSILESFGHEVGVINYTKKSSFAEKVIYFAKSCIMTLSGKHVKFSKDADFKYRSKNVVSFINNNLNFTSSITTCEELKKIINSSFDAIVVGSDQVWRPKYVLGIDNYFLNGVKPEVLKLSYAASFGVNAWEFTPQETELCSSLLEEFSYVSVREKSAITLVKENLKYQGNVYCDIDPTLLVGIQSYKRFLKKENRSPNIFTYILDSSDDKKTLVSTISEFKNLPVCEFNTNAENPSKPLKERVAPPVEDWINGIYNSDFVITDSFHGCAFSILFNKSFVVYANKERGIDRFISLLDLLGLQKRMIFSTSEYKKELMHEQIDWQYVNNQLEEQRELIITRLLKVLNR